MTFSIGLIVYIMIWVVVLFLVLPWGVRIPDKVDPGHATSAPENPYIGLKFLVTSVLSAFLWVIAYLVLRR
jgi:predicted secreted protein